ncbi:MAG: hypothetical protein N3G22_03690, partial [Candidatus Micrarchaeota archaeon]|nr:hypothetical protein [Candidatus Micrarchaeota archaeon]
CAFATATSSSTAKGSINILFILSFLLVLPFSSIIFKSFGKDSNIVLERKCFWRFLQRYNYHFAIS